MRTYLISLLLISCSIAHSQEVVSTAGESYTNASGRIDFTIGEVIISTETNGAFDLTQGFHQTNFKLAELDDHSNGNLISIFPNPAEDILTVQIGALQNVHYDLFDISGKLVERSKLNSEIPTINVNQLTAGTYLLRLSDDHQNIKTLMFIKSR